jgi:hypothetical protein
MAVKQTYSFKIKLNYIKSDYCHILDSRTTCMIYTKGMEIVDYHLY